MSAGVELSLIGAAVVVVLLVLGYRLVRRDSGIRVTRLGVFVERERFEDVDGRDDGEPDGEITREWPASPGSTPPHDR